MLDQQNSNATLVSRPHEFDTGSTDVCLVVVNHRLHVRVVDESGVLQPRAGLVVAHGSGDERMSSRDSGTGELWLGVWFERDDPTATVRLSASSTGMLPAEQVVTVSQTEYEREVELVLRHLDDEAGSLAITVHDEDGRSIERFTATLRTLASNGLVPGFYHATPDSRGVLVGAPPGRWQLRVVPGELLHRAWEELTMFFPIETEVDVQPAEETNVAGRARRQPCALHRARAGLRPRRPVA